MKSNKILLWILLMITVSVSLYAVPANWTVTENTGNFSNIGFLSTGTYIVNGRIMSSGDAIGVFYTRNSENFCAGYLVWGEQFGISVWGDDDLTALKDGFANNEVYTFKIWDNALQQEVLNPNMTLLQGTNVYTNNNITVYSGFVAGVTPLAAPELTLPADLATNVAVNPSFSWNEVANATGYNIVVATTSDFATVVASALVSSPTKTFEGLNNSTQYYWRVNAVTATQTSDWSAVRSFTTEAPTLLIPDVPVLTAPANLAINVLINPTLTWNAASNATTYRVQVALANDFTTPLLNDVVSSTSKALSGLLNSTQYFWRVQAINGTQTSEWSEVRSFTTIKLIAPTSVELNVNTLLTGLWSNNTHKAAAVMVELRSGNVLSSSVLYKRISGILSASGEVSVLINEITNGDYWLIIRATGYLPIASATKINVQGGRIVTYDFSRSSASVFNANMLKAVNGRYLMKVGDLNSDRSISGADMSAVKANSGANSTIPAL